MKIYNIYSTVSSALVESIKINFLLAAFSLMISISSAGFAATTSGEDKTALRQEFNHTYDLILSDPSNVKLNLKYAELAVALEDYEAAIPALERLLFFNPDLPETRLELGVLYYKLHSLEIAKTYFQEAKTSKNATPDIIRKATDYLNKM